MSVDHVVHRLAFALRVEDHFSQAPVPEPLDLRISSGETPVRAPTGSLRHDDGTYRWIDLTAGLRQLSLRSPSDAWVRWDAAPLDISVPLADPATALRVEMWPTARAPVLANASAVRGKLLGPAVAGLRVELGATGGPATGRWTHADADGEFLYLLPGGSWTLTPQGLLDLTVQIAGRTVTRVDVRPGPTSFTGARFELPAQRDVRVLFHLS